MLNILCLTQIGLLLWGGLLPLFSPLTTREPDQELHFMLLATILVCHPGIPISAAMHFHLNLSAYRRICLLACGETGGPVTDAEGLECRTLGQGLAADPASARQGVAFAVANEAPSRSHLPAGIDQQVWQSVSRCSGLRAGNSCLSRSSSQGWYSDQQSFRYM